MTHDSCPFEIKRGTKQGEPMNPMFFNAVLESALKQVQNNRRRKGWGIELDDNDEDRLSIWRLLTTYY